MRVEQDAPEFTPITITLETAQEVEALHRFLEGYYSHAQKGSSARAIAIDLSNKLCAKMWGEL